mgnify:CR=1 FL=1
MTHRILVVDDEPDITALVAYHLAKAGYRVITASNGTDALKAATEQRPDVVVLDLMLPGLSGLDVLQALPRVCRASASTVLRAFKKELGDAPLPYLRKRRLDESLLLLKSKRHSVGEVAAMVGCADEGQAWIAASRERLAAMRADVAALTERWVSDQTLTWIGLARLTTMAEGDMFRLFARTIEFLSQLKTLKATHPSLAESADHAIAAMRRGVLEELP